MRAIPPSTTAPARVLRTPAWAITAVAAAVYLILAPSSPDLAAADYRSWLFSQEGLTAWDSSWYGGHHIPAYSLLAPALGALIGPRAVAAISMVAATAIFERLVRGRFGARAERLASVLFAVGAAVSLLSCRVPFDLGLAIGLGALLAAQRGRTPAAALLCAVCAVASPVAGAFLALALVAWSIAGPRRLVPFALALAALLPIGALMLAFPEGGTQPYVASAFYPALAGVAVLWLITPAEQRTLRIGIFLYGLAMVGSYLLPTAFGGNVDRLGALLAAPLAALALAGPRPRPRPAAGPGNIYRGPSRPRTRLMLLALLTPLLVYWQANAPVADLQAALRSPANDASFYAPLIAELGALKIGYGAVPARIEVVPTAVHWEARWVAPHVMLARGWERQLDRLRNSLFYERAIVTDAEYREWLARTGVSFVALPDAPLDYSAKGEAALLRAGPPAYLREIWRAPHWRLFAVLGATPLASPPARMTSAARTSFSLLAPAPGRYLVRVRFTPYWKLLEGTGCVSRAAGAGEWTEVTARQAGRVRVGISFSLLRVLEHGPRCT